MEIIYATRAANPDVPNDDYILAAERHIVMLDGATAPIGVHSGCVHNVPWLVAELGSHLGRILATQPAWELREVLRHGIARTRESHQATCDLSNPDSPSSTVAIARLRDGRVEYAVLADSAVVIECVDGSVVAVVDDRTSHLPSYTQASISALRNTDEGFWVASTRPEAADRALVGSVPACEVRRVALFTDGATRLTERYGWSWQQMLDRVQEAGPNALIDAVRRHDAQVLKGEQRGKWPSDDISAALWRIDHIPASAEPARCCGMPAQASA